MKITLSAAILFMGTAIMGQQKEGTILYKKMVNMHRTINNDQMKAMIPEFRTSKHQLLFSDSISVYKLIPEDEAPDPFGGGNGGMVIRLGGGADGGELFKNFSQSKSVQANETAGKNFLITDSIRNAAWKLSDETKQILGFTCYKATLKVNAPVMRTMTFSTTGGNTDSSKQTTTAPKQIEVVAWYTNAIPVPAGPDSYGQLPGAILEVNVDNGLTVISATEVKNTVAKKELQEPKKGKVITRSEFQKMITEMMSQGGPMMFRNREN
ncbi:MAG: GLPGLI family protein [Chitinophagaceae bacterium]|nr:GLPGLI family protein [Chitinophagaceae bacterium]